jgi:hypothetical protein
MDLKVSAPTPPLSLTISQICLIGMGRRMGAEIDAHRVQDCKLQEMFAILSAHSVDTSESEYALDSESLKGHDAFVIFEKSHTFAQECQRKTVRPGNAPAKLSTDAWG